MTIPRVSDHALVRFLERAGGLDVEQVRRAIGVSLSRAHTAAVEIGGGDHLIVADGLTWVVRGGVVVTVAPRGSAEGDAHRIAPRTR